MRLRTLWLLALLSALGPAVRAGAQPAQQELKLLSIEELMQIDVTIAGRRDQPVGTTAAAVSVVTRDDIRRAGVTTIADALRLATGVHVARFNTGTWRISARGFNGTTPNKLLVMIDGRTVYSSLFAGVFWNLVDYALFDIERIEVIRGPGAVLWGANAVNGVVNIITRHARDTLGTRVSLIAGTEDPAIAEVRYGAAAGAATWRVFAKTAVRDQQILASGQPSGDRRHRGQVGFRLDTTARGSAWMVKGDAFHSRDDLPARPRGEFTDLSLQARWTRILADASRVDVQTYYRREYRRVPDQLTHGIDTVDLDVQHTRTWGRRHDVVWGGGLRMNWDDSHGSAILRLDPARRTYGLGSVFVQDEIALIPGELFATFGLKYEHNAFSGGELQPNVRARVLLSHNQMLWGSVARAVRRPTRLDDNVVVTGPGDTVLVRGTGEFEAEKLIASEAGYRVEVSPQVSFDATAFWHRIHDLRSQDAPPGGGLPLTIGNTLEGRSRGVELALSVQPVPRWRTQVSYTRLASVVRRQPGSRDVSGGASEANDPGHLLGLRSALDLPGNVELDAMVRAVGALPDPEVPAYSELSVRAGWHVTPRLELSIIGEDLLHDRHPEVGPATPARVEFERAVHARAIFRF